MLDPARYERIRIEKREGGLAVATLDRPDKLNAVDGRMHTELANLARDADFDDGIRALVITGAGRAFCAGGDFGPDSDVVGAGRRGPKETKEIVDLLLDCSIPIVSAVEGYALGLGATVALLADVVVAGRGARFGDTHVNMGIGPGDGGQVIWPLLMGVNRAKYHLMTGEHIAAEDAHAAGPVNFVVDEGAALERALEIGTRLAEGPTQAIRAAKAGVNQYMKFVSNLVLPYSFALEQATFATRDAAEAGAAFREKRPPRFEGR